ncbi:MAG: hypothetical protein VX546_00880 [Myxococcota bacterium]|nr:hypothetical protein [Myxococcota bacterium]
MTVSRAEAIGLALLAALLGGCQTPGGAPPDSAFHPAATYRVPPPDVADQTAVDLARAALVGNEAEAERALRRMNAIETVLDATEEKPTGMLGVSIDLRNAAFADRRSYRRATDTLLDRRDLDPVLRARLEQFQDADPLELADDRARDSLMIEIARAFNAFVEPVGKSLATSQLAPYRLGQSLARYAVHVYTREPISLQRRQALVHWKEFLKRHPDAPEATRVEPEVDTTEQRLVLAHRDRALRVAEKALDLGKTRLALVYSDRALRWVPEDRRATEVRDEAAARLIEIRDAQQRSIQAGTGDPFHGQPEAVRELAVALLLPQGDPTHAARRLREADPKGPLADESRFVDAMLLGEAGETTEMWQQLERLADSDGDASNMQRHAERLFNDPNRNTWQAFADARARNRWDRFKWVLLGPFSDGIPDRGLPGPLEWVFDAPALAEHIGGAPMRLINLPWAKALPSARVTATAARNHLARDPRGPGSDSARAWLERYEKNRGNWIGALRAVEAGPDPDISEMATLRERAAYQYLDAATREPNFALRMGMYKQVGQIYPGSAAARQAGRLARDEADEVTVQAIRLSRGFLEENEEITGPRGLGLRPELLDGNPANAELHPDGVTLVGSQIVRVSFVGPSGDEDDPPERTHEILSDEQLGRVVSLVEEVSYRNMLLDPLDEVGVDAPRDYYFERARLGLAGTTKPRSGEISQYTYQGVRERYGMVRHRESILPFDLVFHGSLSTLSLGAFPRMREPKETPDAFLYR